MPTNLIYNSWLTTPKPLLYKTSDAKGNEIVVDCLFKDPHTHKDIAEVKHECTICGRISSYGIPNKKFFSSNYTDWQTHKNPSGSHVCEACAFTMLLNTEHNRMALSRYSFYVNTHELVVANRIAFRDALLNPPLPPFVMVCAVSQKKHLAIKSKISYSRTKFYCMYEEECVVVNASQMKHILYNIEALRGIGFTKEEIEKQRISFDKVKRFVGATEIIEAIMREISQTRMFPLALHNAQKMKEDEAICYLGLIHKTVNEQQQPCSSTAYTKAATLSADRAATKCGGKLNDSSKPQQNEQLTLLDL